MTAKKRTSKTVPSTKKKMNNQKEVSEVTEGDEVTVFESPMFTESEVSFIAQALTQITFKPGQSNLMVVCESILNKCPQVQQTQG